MVVGKSNHLRPIYLALVAHKSKHLLNLGVDLLRGQYHFGGISFPLGFALFCLKGKVGARFPLSFVREV